MENSIYNSPSTTGLVDLTYRPNQWSDYPWTTIPYIPQSTNWITVNNTTSSTPYISIERVENGFIVTKNYKKYVCKKPEEILKYFQDE